MWPQSTLWHVLTTVVLFFPSVACKDQTVLEMMRNRLQLFYQLVQSRAVWNEPEETVRIGGCLWRRPVVRSKTWAIRKESLLTSWFERTLVFFIDSHLYTWLRAWVNIKVGFGTWLPAFSDYSTSNKDFEWTQRAGHGMEMQARKITFLPFLNSLNLLFVCIVLRKAQHSWYSFGDD